MTVDSGERDGSHSSHPEGVRKLPNEEFEAIIAAANKGDEAARQRLRQLLEWNPDAWKSVVALSGIAMSALVKVMSGDDQLMAESLRCNAADMKGSLVSEGASRLEELAGDRVVVCWMRLQHVEYRCTHLDSCPRGWANYWNRNRDRAQKAYESAVRLLLVVQKAKKPGQRKGRPPKRSGRPFIGPDSILD